MIVRLIRPEEGATKWLLYAPGLPFSFVDATPELAQRMEGESGYFHAKRRDGGWRIGEAAPPQAW
jgi:hypothetical protein